MDTGSYFLMRFASVLIRTFAGGAGIFCLAMVAFGFTLHMEKAFLNGCFWLFVAIELSAADKELRNAG